MDLLVNLAYGVVDAAVIAAAVRYPSDRRAWALGWWVGSLVAVLAATLAAGDAFAGARAAAWLGFVHLPAMLAVAAAVWRPALLASAAVVAVGIDAFWIEPHAVVVDRYTVETPDLDQPLTVVVLADIQTDRVGAYEQDVFDRVNALHPDLILLAGDYVQADPDQLEAQQAAFRTEISTLHAPLGVWAAQGNIDHYPGWDRALFGGTAVHTERGTARTGPVEVTTLGLLQSFDPALVVPDEPGFRIVVGHSPNYALSDRVDGDLLVAGHTHGGQVQVPGFGAPVTMSLVPRAWGSGGLTDLGDGRHLLVSRGIGMERGRAPRLRFDCRPEISVIDLIPQGWRIGSNAANRSATSGQ